VRKMFCNNRIKQIICGDDDAHNDDNDAHHYDDASVMLQLLFLAAVIHTDATPLVEKIIDKEQEK